MRQTFPKKERLYSKKLIELLVEKGNLLNQYPLHIKWLKADLKEKVNAQVAFSVPKRLFKKAVNRNKLRRRMRESYRKNKELLDAGSLAILMVYTSKIQEPYASIEKTMKSCMLKITKKAGEKA